MKILTYLALFILALTSLVSCTKMDDYTKYIDPKEPIYTGKPDSIKAYSGKNRIKLSWLLISDPKIVKTKVFWNNRKDSTVISINRSNGVDSISTIINNLAEGNYNFELITYDKNGNSSVPALTSGIVYGSIYETALPNRAVESVKLQVGGDTFVNWYPSENNSTGVELTYRDNSNINHKIIVPTKEAATAIVNFNTNTQVSYRTMFKPDSLAIDTFYAPMVTKGINEILLKNAGGGGNNPFLRSDAGSRFGILKDWTVNTAVKNIDNNTKGGFDSYGGGGYMAMERWGTPAIPNGKIYQTLTLPKGKYSFEANFEGSKISNEAYLTIAAGTALPDVANISSAIAFSSYSTPKVQFELTEQKEVSIGILANLLNDQQYFRIRGVKLYKL